MWLLKFYADKPQKYTNKYFCFRGTELRHEVMIFLFIYRGNKIRSLFIEDELTHQNFRISDNEILDIYLNVQKSLKAQNHDVLTTYREILNDLRSPKH